MEQQLPATEITALLGRGTQFEGKLHFEGRVRIDGVFKGEIQSDDTLVIGDGAEVHAEIEVATVIVRGGIVHGNIRAKNAIEIHAPGKDGRQPPLAFPLHRSRASSSRGAAGWTRSRKSTPAKPARASEGFEHASCVRRSPSSFWRAPAARRRGRDALPTPANTRRTRSDCTAGRRPRPIERGRWGPASQTRRSRPSRPTPASLAPGMRQAAERENGGERVELVRAAGKDTCVRVAFEAAAPVLARLLDAEGTVLYETRSPATTGVLGDRGPVCIRKSDSVSAAAEGNGGRIRWIAWASP